MDDEQGVQARVRGLRKSFRRGDGTSVRAIDNLDLDVHTGELLVLLGPSGCGKTTLLRSLGGLEEPDEGLIEVFGTTMFSSTDRTWVPPEKRGIGMMFQSYALWPHMTALENVAYPLRRREGGRAAGTARAASLLDLVGVHEVRAQYPGQMSGGQQQRVALARALATGGELILFDEPLSNVDAKVRETLRLELLSMQRELGFTGVYVTHDQSEAMALADRIAVLDAGRIVQIGTPRDIYDHPRSGYVADFVGTGNRLSGRVMSVDGDAFRIDTPLGQLTVARNDAEVAPGAEVELMARPQHWRVSATEPDSINRVRGQIEHVLFLGGHVEIIVAVNDQRVIVHHVEDEPVSHGTDVWLSIDRRRLWPLERT